MAEDSKTKKRMLVIHGGKEVIVKKNFVSRGRRTFFLHFLASPAGDERSFFVLLASEPSDGLSFFVFR